MEKRPFNELGLSPELLKAVDKMGFEEASPIQTAVIPLLLAGRDVIGQSATGSGKTAAFAIPAIERTNPAERSTQVLVLCPTRELALQVAEEFGKLAHFKAGIQEVPIYGGQSYERQFRALEAGAQIVIGTPGRILDHLSRGTLRLDRLRMVVLDEADRMLDLGFRDDIAHILESTPAERQLLFFSATMPAAIRELIQRHTREPEWVRIESVAQNAPAVDQVYFEVDRRNKVELLTRLIDLHDFRYGIIFCSTKIMVDDLEEHLHSRGYSTDRLHGDISQAQRDRVMAKFRQRGFEFLVATDVAARGLDVDDLEVVFNYDLPNDAEDYTHRIGRTGRAGRSGMAFTFVAGRELYKLQSMVRYARLRIRREVVPSLDEVEEARENAFIARIRGVLVEDKYRRQERIIDRLMEEGHSSTDIAAALIHLLQGGSVTPVHTAPGTGDEADTVGEETEAERKPAKAAALPADRSEAKPDVYPDFNDKRAARPAHHEDATPTPPAEAPVRSPAPSREKHPHAAHKHSTAPRTETAPEAPAEKAAPFRREPHAKHEAHSKHEAPAKHDEPAHAHPKRTEKFARQGRTGEAGYVTLRLNLGLDHSISTGEIVGKILGVTRLPSQVVGAVEVLEDHSLVDVVAEHAPFVLTKLLGIRMKGVLLKPAEHRAEG